MVGGTSRPVLTEIVTQLLVIQPLAITPTQDLLGANQQWVAQPMVSMQAEATGTTGKRVKI